MTDIVERLRKHTYAIGICGDAAEEIERLRVECNHWRNIAGQSVQSEYGLRVEIERLRAEIKDLKLQVELDKTDFWERLP